MFKNILIVTAVLGICKAWAMPVANTDSPPWSWEENSWTLIDKLNYFSTRANYDVNLGTETPLYKGASFSLTENSLLGRYNLDKNFSFFLGGSFASVESKTSRHSYNNSGLTEIRGGADVVVMQKPFRLILELLGSYPLDPLDVNTLDPLTNDGVARAGGMAFLQIPLRGAQLYAHAGFIWRDLDLSALAPWGLGAEVQIYQPFWLGAGLEGFESVTDDKSPSSLTRESVTSKDQVDAGSRIFYAYNPSWYEAHAWLAWLPKTLPWEVKLGYGKTLNGTRSASGWGTWLQVSYRFQDTLFSNNDYTSSEASSTNPSDNANSYNSSTRNKGQDQAQDQQQQSNQQQAQPNFKPHQESDPLDETEIILEKKKQKKGRHQQQRSKK